MVMFTNIYIYILYFFRLLCILTYRFRFDVSLEGRHIALLLTAQFYVTSVLCLCVLFSPSNMQAFKHETLTRCRAIVGPPSTTLSQHQPSIGLPYIVFDATLNVGQHHRQRANINPAFVQSIVRVLQPA